MTTFSSNKGAGQPVCNGQSWLGPAVLEDSMGASAKAANLATLKEFREDAPLADACAPWTEPDPSYTIGRLSAAHREPKVIGPAESPEKAFTIMRMERYSQLPVMMGKRKVIGVITLESMASQSLMPGSGSTVRDCMKEPGPVVERNLPLDQARDLVAHHGFVLVRGKDRTIQGIVTSSDMLESFGQIVNPFMLLREIETQLRNLVRRGRFSAGELATAQFESHSGRDVQSVEDLTFGECLRVLERPKHWRRVGLSIDRATFVSKLHAVREIRNKVMHFRVDALSVPDKDVLRKTSLFFWDLRPRRAANPA